MAHGRKTVRTARPRPIIACAKSPAVADNSLYLSYALPAFRARLAARLWDNEQYVEAVSERQRIAAYEPGNVEARVALARAYLKMGDRGRTLDEYRRVLALAPNHAEARQSVARLSAVR